MNKSSIKFIISIVISGLLGFLYFFVTSFIRILFPEFGKRLTEISLIVFKSVLVVGIVLCLILLIYITIREFKYMKLFSNELKYNGLTEVIYKEALKRRDQYRKDKSGSGYIGAQICILNYLSFNKRYEEALEIVKEFDFKELKKAMKIEYPNAPKDKIVNYFSLLDVSYATLNECGKVDEADELYKIFETLFNLFIAKYDYLTDILNEIKFNHGIYTKNFEESQSILDILKTSDSVYYPLLKRIYMEKTKETDLNLIEESINAAYERIKNHPTEGFFKQFIEIAKKDIYDGLNKEA